MDKQGAMRGGKTPPDDIAPGGLDAASLELISAAYRAVHDSDGFDLLVERWARMTGAARQQAADGLASQEPGIRQSVDNAPQPETSAGAFLAIERASGPALVMSAQQSVVAANAAGASAFGSPIGAVFDPGIIRAESRDQYERILQACRAGEAQAYCLLPMTLADGQSSVVAASLTRSAMEGSSLIVLRAIGIGWNDAVGELLERQYGLTEAEARIARALYETADVQRIAEERGRSVQTVRTQLREIFAKTGTSGQVELVRLVSSLCAQRPGDGEAPSEWRDPLGRERQFEVPGRGTLAFSWMGREGGRPALLVHGPMTGCVLRPELQRELERLNIQLYALHRPGFGNSRYRSSACSVEDTCNAMGDLLAFLDLKRVPLVAMISGFVPAARFAAENPDRVPRILCLGACTPLEDESVRRDLPFRQQALLNLALKHPSIADLVARLGMRFMRSRGPEWVLSRLYAESPRDLAAIADPDTFSLLMASVMMLAAQDHRAFVRDLRLIAHPLEPLLERLECDVSMVAGADDPAFPLAQVSAMAARHPFINLRVVEKAGQALVHSHPEECRKALSAFFSPDTVQV